MDVIIRYEAIANYAYPLCILAIASYLAMTYYSVVPARQDQ
jgi:hypothetical protein